MSKSETIATLGALAQPTRLDIFRMLALRGAEGMPPGEIAERLRLPFPTLSFHLSHLKQSGLVVSRRRSRTVFYDARVRAIDNAIAYLVDHCGARPKPLVPKMRTKASSSHPPMKVLFLCTRNSARSVMAECALRRWGDGRFQAFSAGSNPAATVHPFTLRLLSELNYEIKGLHSKSWNQFTRPNGTGLDFVFTLCDRAAAEPCPAWPGQPLRAHWGIQDPLASKTSGSAMRKLFRETYTAIEQRVRIFASLPVEKLERFALERWVMEIGKLDAAA